MNFNNKNLHLYIRLFISGLFLFSAFAKLYPTPNVILFSLLPFVTTVNGMLINVLSPVSQKRLPTQNHPREK